MTTTKEILVQMLTENTGIHMLDSGMANGRNWQQNQGKTVEYFDSIPAVTIDKYDITIDVYHWLEDKLDYNEKQDKIFQRFINQKKYQDVGWLPICEDFVKLLTGMGAPYGEGDASWINTYNSECLLSQTLQFLPFIVPEDHGSFEASSYVILQIHGGADVRGGYTIPRLFGANTEDMFSFAEASLYCEGVDEDIAPGQVNLEGEVVTPRHDSHNWYTDDSYSWYEDGISSNETTIKGLDGFEWNEELEAHVCPYDGTKIQAFQYV